MILNSLSKPANLRGCENIAALKYIHALFVGIMRSIKFVLSNVCLYCIFVII